MITIFLGSPGTGKGTISKRLVDKYGYKHISTGDLFREITKTDSTLGKRVKETIESGKLVSDEMTNEVLEDDLNKLDLNKEKIILDGYPRTINQAIFLEKFLQNNNGSLKSVIFLTLNYDEQIKRLTGRLNCPSCSEQYHKEFIKPKIDGVCDKCGANLIQREDDKLEKVEVRLKTYDDLTMPLIDFFKKKDKLIEFDTSQDYKKLSDEINKVLNE